MTEPILTDHQKAILEFAYAEDRSLMVKAVAGSGKTFTMVKTGDELPLADKNIAVAFNKSIATELSGRMPSHIETSTFNALGFRHCRERGIYKTVPRKATDIAKDEMGLDWALAGKVAQLVSVSKSLGFGFGGYLEISDLLEHMDFYGIYPPEDVTTMQLAELSDKLFQRTIADMTCVDFDDQIYFGLFHEWFFDKYDTVLVDEAQDLSPMQHLYLARCAKRVIAFGDPRQAIYGFRGADSNSMTSLGEMWGAAWLPLTCSFRCPKLVTELAKELEPEFTCLPDAIEGIIDRSYASEIDLLIGDEGSPRDTLVICRNNAPLFSLALRCIIEKIPFNYRGRFVQQLLSFLNRFKSARTIEELRARILAWKEKELARAAKEGWKHTEQRVEDQYQALVTIMGECSTPGEVKSMLEDMADAKGGYTLSTIHQAKGLERKHIHFLDSHLIPSRYAEGDPVKEQWEDNLLYVAITRALETLTYTLSSEDE